jgi:hypothetical protein
MLRSLLALLMILLAAPACAGSRFGGGFHGTGFHRGGFPAFLRGGGRARGFFGGYVCGYNCGLGFDSGGYDYGYGGYGGATGTAMAAMREIPGAAATASPAAMSPIP